MNENAENTAPVAESKARPCPKCGRIALVQHSTRRKGGYTARYFTCKACGHHSKTIETPPK